MYPESPNGARETEDVCEKPRKSPTLPHYLQHSTATLTRVYAHTYTHTYMHTYIYRIAPENGKLTAARRAGLYNPEIKGVLYPENG